MTPFGLSLSKPVLSLPKGLREPFDGLRANGDGCVISCGKINSYD